MGNKSARAVTPSEKALQSMLTRASTLRPDMFAIAPVGHHGVPSNAKTMAFCSLQGILAVGTASGSIKLYGRDGLEVMFEAPRSKANLTVGVVHMKFTARQRLVVTYTDSSIRVFDLTSPGISTYVPETWTTCTITCIETIVYLDFSYIFVALDDGTIRVIHEETGKISTYVVTPRDLGITTTEEDRQTQYVTAMASNPRDANQLLVAYEATSTIYLWDFAKRKLNKDFTLPKQKASNGNGDVNSPRSFSWHSSGKRFVAGFKHGGFGVFRTDKPNGMYHMGAKCDQFTPIDHIHWLCAPPISRNSHLPGAVVYSGGRSSAEKNLLTIVYPGKELVDEDAIATFVKCEQLSWQVMTTEAPKQADITVFAVSDNQVDYCSTLAPFSVLMLSGNPLDGCQPAVSIHNLPCFVRLREDDKEDWEWIPDLLPRSQSIPPCQLQKSPLKAFTIVDVAGASFDKLSGDLLEAFKKADKDLDQTTSEDFEWPLNGGSVAEPLHKSFLPIGGQHFEHHATMILSGHADGRVLFWVPSAAAERSSTGTLQQIHCTDVVGRLNPTPDNTEVTCVAFCPQSRMLVVGFTGGEVAVLEFGGHTPSTDTTSNTEQDSAAVNENPEKTTTDDSLTFRMVFSLHIHSSEISKIAFSSTYNCVFVADNGGVVSMIDLSTQNYELIIFDISSEEPVSVDYLYLSELIETTEIPAPQTQPIKSGSRSPPRSPFDRRSSKSVSIQDPPEVIQHHQVVPVLFVGRGNGKLEMFHIQSAKKVGELVIDAEKANPVSSVIMVSANGRRIDIEGRAWSGPEASTTTGTSLEQVDVEVSPCLNEEAQPTPRLAVSEEDTLFVHKMLMEAIADTLGDHEDISQGRETPKGGSEFEQTSVLELRVPPGSLGLHLYTDIEPHAVVKGFVTESETGQRLASEGVRRGHAIVSINGVNLLRYNMNVVCSVLQKVRDREKVIVFAQGYGPLPDDNEVLNDTAGLDQPRLLVCCCGKSVHLVQAGLPNASDIASGPRELPADPISSIELGAQIMLTSIVRVPVHDHIENCVAVVDQLNTLYILALPSLRIITTIEGLSLGSVLDGIQSAITSGGELIVANSFGEVERWSLFSEAVAKESAMLEFKSVKTRVLLDERKYPFEKEQQASPKKKSGISDAGKMLKKLVTGIKDVGDLNKVFQFSTEDEERQQLMGHRKSIPGAKDSEATQTEKVSQGLGATKDALAQATQQLHQRGEKLGDLALKTEQMKDTAQDFYKSMKAFNDKNANKKWYEF
ncbi:hypothetical protein Poli38472_014436 [Pythium oligandrum]|uniref:V-SNARE coiled-coil homology domain-containing protein n=1 Tax=Pythium oligandrum TaxID=41045 RepID=A0A8K1C7T9_PYTOL|nr:hypothetical protein Poli38472_014436 [Pythium oligandrum]|eukprot:TMW57833.1 hypothetical protein Poli38472_014436 [Pythium oligandrum]